MWKRQYLICSYSNRLLSDSSETAVPKVGPWTHSVSITWNGLEMQFSGPAQTCGFQSSKDGQWPGDDSPQSGSDAAGGE